MRSGSSRSCRSMFNLAMSYDFFGVYGKIPINHFIRQRGMNVASENQPAMFLGIFFRLRFAGGLDFELAPEHESNRDGINSLFVAHNFRFCCLTIAGGLTNTRKGIIIYFPILYSPLLYYGVLKRRNSAVIHFFAYYGSVSACHNYSGNTLTAKRVVSRLWCVPI